MISMRSAKPKCAPPHLREVFPNVAFETVPMFEGDLQVTQDKKKKEKKKVGSAELD